MILRTHSHFVQEGDKKVPLRIIGPAEGVRRQIQGILAILVALAAGFYPTPLLPFPRQMCMLTGGAMVFNTGYKFQCGTSLRGLWNVDAKGYTTIPEEYREFAAIKAREFLRDMLTIFAICVCGSYGMLYVREELDAEHALRLLDSFCIFTACAVSVVYAYPLKTRPSCS